LKLIGLAKDVVTPEIQSQLDVFLKEKENGSQGKRKPNQRSANNVYT